MGRITKGPVTPEGLAHIVRHLRVRDREEIFALRWDNDEENLVRDVMRYAGAMSWIWSHDNTPVSVQGSHPIRPGVWVNWCFGTDDWRLSLLSMTRHSKAFIIPALLRANFHRAEAFALASHTDARGWIEALGGRFESTSRGAGRNGEDFVTYVWTPADVRRKQRP